ncbi:ACT domain-containing protein [Shimia abyssi]|uniref:Uncharacterized protein n=1 Tax=Shimia abyssi TaxID=1662395 RepID=A0A2P8FHQ5_9RHOB|nr:ACT domain-containing protein [Shimia abyssi]PSL21262.1 hypothetical protein CLV88_102382 [Shimia abyssi]
MSQIVKSAHAMIAGMTPQLRPEVFVFSTLTDLDQARDLLPVAFSATREEEGLSLVLPIKVAQDAGHATDQPMHCITLNVYSALDGVGLTAAVASALAAKNIPCNMIAGYHHDHVLVPDDRSAQALSVLQTLQSAACA